MTLLRKRNSCGVYIKMFSEEERAQRLKEQSRLYYLQNREIIRIKQTKYYEENRDRIRAHQNSWQKNEGKETWRRSHNEYVKKNQQKIRARRAISNAIQAGKLKKQPCVTCGKSAQAHHPDYSKPFDIIWLCRKHHQEEHNRV